MTINDDEAEGLASGGGGGKEIHKHTNKVMVMESMMI
jgi:hypothetical protein